MRLPVNRPGDKRGSATPRTLTVSLILAWLGLAAAAGGQNYWPGEGEPTFIYRSPPYGSVEYTLGHYGLTSTLTYARRVGGAHTIIGFVYDAAGDLCLVDRAVVFRTDAVEHVLDRPVVLLPADFKVGDSWTHAGTCTGNWGS